MSEPFSPLILPTEDSRGLQSSLLTVIDALNVVTPRLGSVEDILAAAGLATRRIGAVPMTWLGVWTASFVYLRGDVVTRNLLLMIANKTTTETPVLAANDWDLLMDGTATGGTFKGARVEQETVTLIQDSVSTPIVFTKEIYDVGSFHDNSINNTRLTVSEDSRYLVTGSIATVQFTSFSSSQIWIAVNGEVFPGHAGSMDLHDGLIQASRLYSATTVLELSVNDYVELWVFLNTGADRNTRPGAGTNFTITKMG